MGRRARRSKLCFATGAVGQGYFSMLLEHSAKLSQCLHWELKGIRNFLSPILMPAGRRGAVVVEVVARQIFYTDKLIG